MLFLVFFLSIFCVNPQINRSYHLYPQGANDAHLLVLPFQRVSVKSCSLGEVLYLFASLGEAYIWQLLRKHWSLQDKDLFPVLGQKEGVHCHCQLRGLCKQNPDRAVCRGARSSRADNMLLCTSVFLHHEGSAFQRKSFRNFDHFWWKTSTTKSQIPKYALMWFTVMIQSLLKVQRREAIGGH